MCPTTTIILKLRAEVLTYPPYKSPFVGYTTLQPTLQPTLEPTRLQLQTFVFRPTNFFFSMHVIRIRGNINMLYELNLNVKLHELNYKATASKFLISFKIHSFVVACIYIRTLQEKIIIHATIGSYLNYIE